MNYTNLFMVRGDTFGFDIEIDGLEDDLTEAYFSCRKDYNATPVTYVFQKTLGDGIEKVEDTEVPTYHIELASEDTDNVEIGCYYYDLQLVKDDEVFTPLIGVLQISYDVTRPSGGSV